MTNKDNDKANNDVEDFSKIDKKRAKIKVAKDKLYSSKKREGGLVIVTTGKGKGKTSSMLGMVLRYLGHGKKVAIIQFVKGGWESGEKLFFDKYKEQITFKAMGEGFSWNVQDKKKDIKLANEALEEARKYIEDEDYSFVLLDEVNIALRYDYLEVDDLIKLLKNKREELTVACTGRNAKQELIDMADLVTEMVEVKHHFKAGYKAQKGIEY